jgi:DNA repair and recombination protein RAD54B
MRRSSAPSQRFAAPGPSTTTDSANGSSFTRPFHVIQAKSAHDVNQTPVDPSVMTTDAVSEARYFNVVFCKSSTRKHKKYEDDAVLVVRPRARLAVLKEVGGGGKEIARGSGLQVSKLEELASGDDISFGGKDVEIMEELSKGKFESLTAPSNGAKVEEKVEPDVSYRPKVITKTVFKPFSVPAKFGTKFASPARDLHSRPMFDVSRPDALVLPRPPFDRIRQPSTNAVITDVIVDPHLSKQLRPHQRAGVVFLYRSVMGFNDEGSRGAILADEMGLGKTLQTITLIWTLLKQGPWGGKPTAKKVLILAPSSLVKNWQAEFGKWLGSERITVFGVDQTNRVTEYIKRPHLPVLIMSYGKDYLRCEPPFLRPRLAFLSFVPLFGPKMEKV